MPELPEVETVRRGLAPVFETAAFSAVEPRRKDLRFPLPDRFARRLRGRRVTVLGRRGKYLVGALDDGATLVMHLGMSGSFRVTGSAGSGPLPAVYWDRPRDAAHDHVVFRFESGAEVTYNDPRRFGFMLLVGPGGLDAVSPLDRLGPEPLDPAFDGSRLAGALQGRRTSLKAALLDQRVVAGLGNIYVCEALWQARIAPTHEAGTLARAKPAVAERLAVAIRRVLTEAIAAGGSTLRDHARTDGTPGGFQERFAVYDRAGARCQRRGCSGTIERIVQNGRATYHCPVCQG
jgi:formamidopyrimidine-DNA glycosylase